MSSTLQIQTPRAFLPLLKPARYKGAHGGRGSGKSHFFAERLVEECLADPTTRAVCVREIQKSLDQSVKQLIADKIDALGVGDSFEIMETEIHVLDDEGKRSGLIIFQGMQNHTAASIKSLEGYRIAWVEEAQSLSKVSLKLLTPTIRSPGSEIWFSWNPDKPTDPVDEFMRSADAKADPDILCIEVNYSDNPWFWDTPLAADMRRDQRRDPDKYAHVWAGGYDEKSDKQVFKNWRVEAFETPADAVLRFGADWGYSVDPTALIRMFVQGRTLFIDYEAYKVGCEVDEIPALFAGECPTDGRKPEEAWKNPHGHAGVPGALKWLITADSARPETISHLKRRKFRIVPAVKGARSLEEGVEFLKSFDIVVHPRCKNTIAELTNYSWKVDPATDVVLPVLADKDNHLIDAARYALENLRRAKVVGKPEREPERRREYTKPREEGGAEWMAA